MGGEEGERMHPEGRTASRHPKTKVYGELLGGFTLQVGESTLYDSVNRSKKMWNLLAYLLIFRQRAISQTELIDVLWPSQDSDNPVSALKTLVSRIRTALVPHLGEEVDLVVSRRRSYAWNPDLTCILDVERFEGLCKKAGDIHLDPMERKNLYRQALELYKGDFLPRLSDELWVVPLAAHYQGLYIDGVKTLASMLDEAGEYKEIADLCLKAIQVDPYDEYLHTLLIMALYKQGNTSGALNQYEVATELLYNNLGVNPSKELRAIYLQIMKERKSVETDLGIIESTLKEETAEGAFVCDYGFFKEAYRLEARRGSREGSCAHIGLLTLTTANGAVPRLQDMNKTMALVLNTLKDSLRKGDVISRYSGAQYVILLPNANHEDSVMVLERIIKIFYRQHRNVQLKLSYKVHPVELKDR